jgi:hypothetical protein
MATVQGHIRVDNGKPKPVGLSPAGGHVSVLP